MVKKVITRISFICLTSVVLNILYHVFFTNVKYTRNPPYIVPDLELPTFFIITFILSFILENFFLHSNGIWAFIFALFVAIIFYSSATVIENKYAYLYEHYYQTTSYKNLTHLQEYEKLRENRLTLGKALKNEGIKIKSIKGGYTDKGHQVNSPEDYHKKIYYVNDDIYIIFDWVQEKITAQEDKQSIRQAIAKQYGSIPKRSDIRLNHSSKYFTIIDKYGMTLGSYIIEPSEEGTFKFIEG